MNVCIVCNLFPPDVGGPATYVPRLATDLVRRGHRVHAVVGAPPGLQQGERDAAWPFALQRISRGLPLPVRLVRFFVAASRAARAADVVYVNGLAGPELVSLLAARLAGRPVGLKVVGDFAWEYAIRRGWTSDGIDEFQTRRYGLRVEAVRRLVRLWARLATMVIVPSHYLKGIVAGWGVPLQRLTVIPNALSIEGADQFDRQIVRRELGLTGPIIVTVARLYPWKNLDFLLELLPDLSPQAQLVLVGDGPERPRLEALAREAGVAGRVRFTGGVPQQTVQRYLRAADVFVLNTRYEGLSHAILEAMAAGTPVVASRVGGNVELLEHGRTGLLVPLNDRHAIAGAICRLLEQPQEAARLACAAREAVGRFSWPALVEATERALAVLAATTPPGHRN